MSSKEKIAVIIPVYRSFISFYEQVSLLQCCKVLGNYTIILIKPTSLSVDHLFSYKFDFRVESFDDLYFNDIKGYNQLMLSALFYQRFLQYQYILIHQLDAFVFSDQLNDWCNQEYDYIGAPWIIGKQISPKKKLLIFLNEYFCNNNMKQYGTRLPHKVQFINKVGNGGFSLRKVAVFYELCLQEKEMICYYNSNEHHYFNEDVFWSLEANRKQMRLRIPDFTTAVYFSVELFPEYAFKLTSGRMPFGCHEWDKHIEFWRPFLKEYGYKF